MGRPTQLKRVNKKPATCTVSHFFACVLMWLNTCGCFMRVQVKARVMAATGWPDNAATHLATALVTGVVSTTVTNPVDVVKTFMFVGEHTAAMECTGMHGCDLGKCRPCLSQGQEYGPLVSCALSMHLVCRASPASCIQQPSSPVGLLCCNSRCRALSSPLHSALSNRLPTAQCLALLWMLHEPLHVVVCCAVLPAAGGSKYRNPWRCATAIYEAHGLAGFCRGWLANYARLGPQTVMTFLVVEQLRGLVGMEPL